MIREIPCILLLFSDLFPPQPQGIPQNHSTAAEQTPEILKGMIPLRRAVLPRTRGETLLLLFLSRLPLLGSEQSQKVCSREGEPNLGSVAWDSKRGPQIIRNCQRDCREREAHRRFTAKWWVNIRAHLRTAHCGSDPKQRASSSEMCTLKEIIAQIPDSTMDCTHAGQIQMTPQRL